MKEGGKGVVAVSELLEGLFGCPAQSAKWRYHTVIQGGTCFIGCNNNA